MNWINFDYAQPEHKQRVLVYGVCNNVGLTPIIYLCRFHKGDTFNKSCFSMGALEVHGVTHWMPLPPTPGHEYKTLNDLDDDEDDFEPCANCDLPDACADFGCAIKNGIRKNYPIDGIF